MAARWPPTVDFSVTARRETPLATFQPRSMKLRKLRKDIFLRGNGLRKEKGLSVNLPFPCTRLGSSEK
jgi:hypothetical protein